MTTCPAESPVAKALWYVESHLAAKLSLDDVAAVAGLSPFHLTRAFGFAIGYSVMRYLRYRRLSRAAELLAAGGEDILGLALESGYGSHEAFSRAFRDRFGRSPKEVRRQGHVENLNLVEAATMTDSVPVELPEPSFVDSPPRLLAGLSRTYSFETHASIPTQWEEFGAHLGHVPGQVGATAFGVVHNADDEGNYDYLSAVEVADFSRLDDATARLRLPEQRYAVFALPGHVSTVRAACLAIWNHWLPESGFAAAEAPFFELYPETFDAETGEGGFEVWLPIES